MRLAEKLDWKGLTTIAAIPAVSKKPPKYSQIVKFDTF
jgi:hypothetical protein